MLEERGRGNSRVSSSVQPLPEREGSLHGIVSAGGGRLEPPPCSPPSPVDGLACRQPRSSPRKRVPPRRLQGTPACTYGPDQGQCKGLPAVPRAARLRRVENSLAHRMFLAHSAGSLGGCRDDGGRVGAWSAAAPDIWLAVEDDGRRWVAPGGGNGLPVDRHRIAARPVLTSLLLVVSPARRLGCPLCFA